VKIEHVIELNAPGSGNWQGAARNTQSGEWFLAHSQKRPGADGVGQDDEDVVFYRFNRNGKYLDSMTLLGGAHVYGFGVSSSNIIWASHNGDGRNDVVTFAYRPDAEIGKDRTRLMHVFTDNRAWISFSPSREWAAIMERTDEVDTYRRYAKQDILDNVNRPRGKAITIPRTPTRVVQGFSLKDDYLYLLLGSADAPAWLEKWSFVTAKRMGRVEVSTVGFKEGEAKGKREPEGMDGDLFFIKVWTGEQRRLRGYRHNY
jgi:hypothetical protein